MSGGNSGIELITAPRQIWSGKPVTIKVTDIGKSPVHVTTSAVLLRGKCAESVVKGVHISPGMATIQPGGTFTAHVTVPPSPGDYGVVTVAVAQHHGAAAAEAIGTQVLNGKAKSCVPVVSHHVAAVAAPSGGFPLVWLVVGLILLVLAVVGTAVWRRRA